MLVHINDSHWFFKAYFKSEVAMERKWNHIMLLSSGDSSTVVALLLGHGSMAHIDIAHGLNVISISYNFFFFLLMSKVLLAIYLSKIIINFIPPSNYLRI